MILAGDIGGTNTRLALFENGKVVVEKRYLSKAADSLEKIVGQFLETHQQKIQRACFGIAGPIRDGACKTTNLPWMVEETTLSRELGIPAVHLLNDLEAKAYGTKVIDKKDLIVLQPGNPEAKGNQAIIAAGTGLGEAGLYWDGQDHHPFACEGGHVEFGPRDALEVDLLKYLMKKFGHVSYERVVSGPGIYLLYQFLTETGREKASAEVEEVIKSEDPPMVISEYATKHDDAACKKTLDLFLSLYGAAAGNLALKFLSLGGVFIAGAIARSMITQIQSGAFIGSFVSKGRFKELLESIPVYFITNRDNSLLGAAYYASKM
jgi:glucokinase